MIKKLFTFLTVFFLFWGCSKDLHVQIPSYIQIDSYKVKLKVEANQGTSNQNFTDMLVYANGQTYGTYPIGAKIPVLTSGPTSFIIRGVVRMNGVDLLRADYEVMKGCDTLINVVPGQVTHVTPVFEYFSTAQFDWLMNFENDSCGGTACGSIATSYTGHPETATIYSPGYGGKGSCLALRPNDSTCCSYASVQSKPPYIGLPSGGVGVYMELNYQSNVIIQVYISGDGGVTQTDCGGIYPKNYWAKTYLNLTEQVSSLRSQTGYIIYFVASYDGNPNDQALIDNIKIITAAP
ncbi:MAG TPA: hypothetical protein VK835_14465 [Bacteroidia bacterium]|jgi:hypothetical protein|nr:hypothetical protein [Bacteroidia bacterium]